MGEPTSKSEGRERRPRPAGQGRPNDRTRQPVRPLTQGLAARQVAVAAIAGVMEHRRSLDDAFDTAQSVVREPLEARDRALARLITLEVLRHAGELKAVISSFIAKPIKGETGKLWPILMSAAAQLLYLDTPPHAAISLAVDQCRKCRYAHRYDKLANAVLRRTSERGKDLLADGGGARLSIPSWLMARWDAAYGAETASAIAAASLAEAPLDLSIKDGDAAHWAALLQGEALTTGSVRLPMGARVEDLAGFAEGAWWVQDAAAALPAKLLGDVSGLAVADLCAAPGGKTAQLAAKGARVTAVDISAPRMARVSENLARLKLSATLAVGDLATWTPDVPFDAVLLDAPCSATGTIRRHPDILYLKREDDIATLAGLQATLLDRAAAMVRPGGRLVYCTCSLEPDEGERQIEAFFSRTPGWQRQPIAAGEAGIDPQLLTKAGDLRTLPSLGLDGFFAARLIRDRL